MSKLFQILSRTVIAGASDHPFHHKNCHCQEIRVPQPFCQLGKKIWLGFDLRDTVNVETLQSLDHIDRSQEYYFSIKRESPSALLPPRNNISLQFSFST